MSVRLVLRAPQVPWVLVASLLGRLPLGAAPLALLLFARDTLPLWVAGVLVGAYTAGTAVGQPALARMADRRRQPPVMWGAVALSTAGLLTVAAGPGTVAAIIGAFAAGAGAPPFESCLRVLWTDLVPDRLRPAAYTLDVAVQEVIFIAGPLVTLAATAVAGPTGGLLTTALVQLLGTAVFTAAPAVRRWRGEPAPRHWAGPLRAARLRLILGAILLVGAGIGGTTVAVAAYADAHGARSWAGWLIAANATGALLGGLIFTAIGHRIADTPAALPALVALLAAGYAPLLIPMPVPVMALAMVVSGLALPPVLTRVFLATDRIAPPGTAAEAFAWVATAFAVGSALGAAANGALVDAVGRVTAGFAPAPLLLAAATLLTVYDAKHHHPAARPTLAR